MRRGFEVVSDKFRKYPDCEIILPCRATNFSAGYDICCNESFNLMPGSTIVLYTDVKSKMKSDEVLKVYIRSSIAIKKDTILINKVGIIDSDYYSNPKNDGNILLPLKNIGNVFQSFEKGERIAQGIFQKYLYIENDFINTVREGGVGSTN